MEALTCQYLDCKEAVPFGRRKYCCQKHCLYAGLKVYRIRERAPLLAEAKTCKKCKAPFHILEHETLARKYCPACRQKPSIERTCSECGITFKREGATLRRKNICSVKCAQDRHRRFARESANKNYKCVSTGNCQHCGDELKAGMGWKFCTWQHADEYRKSKRPSR